MRYSESNFNKGRIDKTQGQCISAPAREGTWTALLKAFHPVGETGRPGDLDGSGILA